jgi:hypothetical protein
VCVFLPRNHFVEREYHILLLAGGSPIVCSCCFGCHFQFLIRCEVGKGPALHAVKVFCTQFETGDIQNHCTWAK